MSSALKNRLVGTIIVVALVVILLPELLDGEKQVSNQAFVDIPPAPENLALTDTERVDIGELNERLNPEPELSDELPVDIAENQQSTVSATMADESNANSMTESAQVEVDPQTNTAQSSSDETPENMQSQSTVVSEQTSLELPTATEIQVQNAGWVVQLGSFSNQENVRKLTRNLTNAGYRVYSRQIETRVGVLTKVFIGPELDRDTLEQALPHLRELTGLTGKITEFEVSAE